MGNRRIVVLLSSIAVSCCVAGAITSMATASHPRPKQALQLRLPLVPTFDACAESNRFHGPPLAYPSCSPPRHSSNSLTLGAQSEGVARIKVFPGAPGPPSDSEVVVTLDVTDVRCKAGTTPCGNANFTGGADYIGDLQGNATIRLTDHWNATSPGGGTDPATVVDIPFPVTANCINTADPSIGAACAIDTSVQPGIPDPCSCEGKQMLVGFTAFRVFDGGPDGQAGTTPNTPFLSQGLFVP